MLADAQDAPNQFGELSKNLHLQETSLLEILDFISGELPRWRDRGDRKVQSSETGLTSQLCAHLNSAARRSVGWDYLQFRVEEPDEHALGRKIDLVPAPCDCTVWIEGRRHVDFDALLPIECKRLPTPQDHARDEREYVFSGKGSTGGIQRFKEGHHGAAHRIGAMIGYVQQESHEYWLSTIEEWIKGLVAAGQAGWALTDAPILERADGSLGISILGSSHARNKGLPSIKLQHLWVTLG